MDVLNWVDFIVNNAALMNEVDDFSLELDKLNKMFEAKCTLTELQATHLQLNDDFTELKKNLFDKIDTFPARLGEIKVSYQGLMDTLDPLEKLFGSSEEFECINKDGKIKTIQEVLAGKTHILL